MNTSSIERIERLGYGLALILAPITFAVGFGIHPKDGDTGAAALQTIADHRFRWELAHVLLVFAAALLIPAAIGIYRRTDAGKSRLGLAGAALTIFGAVFFASLIAAEGLASSALASVPVDQRAGAAAGAQAIIDSKGALPVVNLAFVMLLGLILLGVGLLKDASLPRWVGVCVIAGAIVLAPIISEQVSGVGGAIMLLGFGYVGLEFLRNAGADRVIVSEEHRARPARA